MIYRQYLWLFFCALVLAIGCSSTAPEIPEGVQVGGKVYLPDRTVLTGGRLVLVPVGGVFGASAEIQPDGSFTLKNQREEASVVPGKYRVYIKIDDAKLRRSIPEKYQNSEDGDSDIEVLIDRAQPNLEIRLKQ
jgi:hypothetical protein